METRNKLKGVTKPKKLRNSSYSLILQNQILIMGLMHSMIKRTSNSDPLLIDAEKLISKQLRATSSHIKLLS